MSKKLPDFLIIGAMKAGTTTLHRDLSLHPSIFLPEHKEPNALASDAIFSDRGLKLYKTLFARAKLNQLCGEASTAYAKLPDVRDVPKRALQVLGSDVKVIYMVREPLRRAISHHYHDYGFGLVGPNINEAIREHPRYINYSRYAFQITPWIEAFGREQVGIWRFEDYISNKLNVVKEICQFLGVDKNLARVNERLALNVSSDKSVPTPVWRHLVLESLWYTHYVKPCLPWRFRQWLASSLWPNAPPAPMPLSDDYGNYVRSVIKEDMDQLRRIMGLTEPVWPIESGQKNGNSARL